MSKILAIADVHIHDYPQKNPTDKFRLHQSKTIAQNVIKVGHLNGAEILVIAGDIMEKSLIRPYVQAEIKLFLETLAQNFKAVYLIYGNHDQDNKQNQSNLYDSCLGVMLPSNVYYADKKEIIVDGARIGFTNWRPEIDLTWVDGKLDILFTHATIAYNDNDRYQSQPLDETKFDIAFCGDIHSAKQKGKYVSIGVPQRAKMGDSEHATGVLIDCASKKWEWVNLDPDENLMKLAYTDDQSKEGWDEKTGTWYAYKPSDQSFKSGNQNIEVAAWENINALINQAIESAGLSAVHSEVLKSVQDVESKEVNFQFLVKRLYIHNWRSIGEAEIYFDQGDKIKIVGANGCGKSSLLSALKYAFTKNLDMKNNISFGADSTRLEVEFVYQGISYKITRGTKRWGLDINGTPEKYNNKRQFEEDLENRFKFLSYITDVMFIDSDHPKFIGSITPERKSEIISKFYKLDKIDAYNGEAQFLVKKYIDQGNHWNDELKKAQELINYMDSKLSITILPTLTEQELLNKKAYGQELQSKWMAYNNYVQTAASLIASRQSKTDRLNEVSSQMQGFRDITLIDSEIAEINNKISWIQNKNSELGQIKNEGRRVYNERVDLDKAKTCPSCGQPIKQEHLEEHKAELDRRINELLEQQRVVYQEFETVGLLKEEVDNGCRNTISLYNQEIAKLIGEKNEQARLNTEYKKAEFELKLINDKISSLGPEPEKIELPENFMSEMGKIESDLEIWKQYNSLIQDKTNTETAIANYKSELEKLTIVVNQYQDYIKLTGTTGKIYEEIMRSLAEKFTDNRVEYTVKVTTGTGNRKDHLDLESRYRLTSECSVLYQNASDGQRTFMDIHMISRILSNSGLGFLVLDEALKYLDSNRLEEVLEMISELNINLLLLSSHMPDISHFQNKTLSLTLNESGETQIQMLND